ncbi:MAG: transcription antitermination factor NusB [Candidatus Helarchaeota archaeon]
MDNAIDREILAAKALSIIEKEGASERDAINKICISHKITDWKIRSSFHALVFETIRYKMLIDFILNSVMKKGHIETLKNEVLKNILRVGVYRIKILNKETGLTCNTLVEYVKNKFSLRSSKFVNAILRSVERFDLDAYYKKLNLQDFLTLKYSHPNWYFDLLRPYHSDEFIISLLEQNNKNLPICVRINPLKSDMDDVIKEFQKEDFKFKIYNEIPNMIEIYEGNKPVVQTESYKKNKIYIQSKASIIVSLILDPQPGELIFDLTAAPGSKTTHIAQLMYNRGKILAFDRSVRRLKEIKNKSRILKTNIIHPIIYNSLLLEDSIKYKADRILVDPPCSGTGVYSNRPIMKWKSIEKDLKFFTKFQWNLLFLSTKLIKPGGIIVYSTCSISVDENEFIIKKLLSKNKNFELLEQKPFIGDPGLLGLNKTQRLYPHIHNTEGFYIAKLKFSGL